MDVQTQAAVTANKIAITAISISIAALFISYLQLLLGNFMSGNALWKTDSAAMGVSSKHRSFRVGFRRVRVLYPQINFRIEHLLEAARRASDHSIETSFLADVVEKRNYSWLRVHGVDQVVDRQINDGTSALVDPRGQWPVFIDQLPTMMRLRYKLWRSTHHLFPPDRPRATWAQTIQALGITDAADLVLNRVDADTIPSGIDVPIQRIKLVDLGFLALFLGCKRVDIEINEKYFKAWGPHCTITVEDIPMFGRAARFAGDVHSIHRSKLGLHSKSSADHAMSMIMGHLGAFSPPLSFFSRLTPSALAVEAETIRKDILDHLFENFSLHSTNSHVHGWQKNTQLIVPSLLAGATVASISHIFCGFPKKALNPVLNWGEAVTSMLWEGAELSQGDLSVIEDWRQLALFIQMDTVDDFPSTVRNSPFAHEPMSAMHGRLEWLADSLPINLQKEILPMYDSSDKLKLVRIPIMSSCVGLIKEYRPSLWAGDFEEQQIDGRNASAQRALWLQVLLLDLSIRLQIRGRWQNLDLVEPEGHRYKVSSLSSYIKESSEIIEAIEKSYRIDTANASQNASTFEEDEWAWGYKNQELSDFKTWNLDDALMKYCVFYKDVTTEEAEARYKRLAVMLKLRALFFIAFLDVGPNSSAVYEARHSEAQIPII